MTEPAQATQTIFWDIGGVILTNGWDVDQRARVLTRLGVDLAEYEARHDAANFYWERGLSTAREFFDRTVFFKPRDFTFEQLWQGVCGESGVLNPECYDILDRLGARGRYRLATLNNESRELNAYRLDAFDLRRRFAYFICSGYVHEMKPLPGIYRAAIDISGLTAGQALFIDDKQENCDAATAFNMKAIRFESPAQLRAELLKMGVEA
ncbi:MAG: HAD-IA family hydrolase [Acidobacteriaceae bacterium]